MRKTLSLVVLITLLVGMFGGIGHADSLVKVKVNGNEISFPDAKPFINQDGRTLVPVRFIAEELGATVSWNEEKQEVGIKGNGKDISLVIGRSEAYVGNQKVTFDTKAILKENRTFVPLRFVSEALGSEVEWVQTTKTIYITTGKTENNNEYTKIEELLPNRTAVMSGGRTLAYANVGEPAIGNVDFHMSNDTITVKNQKPETLNAIKIVLSVYYPTEYEKAFKLVQTTPVSEVPDVHVLDGRPFCVSKFDTGEMTIFLKEPKRL